METTAALPHLHRARRYGPPTLLAALWVLALAWAAPAATGWGLHHLPAGIGLALTVVALYLLPGMLILRLLWTLPLWSVTQRLALALSIGCALPPLLLQGAHLLRLPWNRVTTLVYVGLMALAWLWLRRRDGYPRLRLTESDLLALGLTLVASLARLYVVRDLPVGLWGDSYQHTMMAQLLVDHRGLFRSWQPYAPLATFTYHFGFHANVALFHWLTGLPVTRSVVIVGQVLNVAALLGVYALTTQLSGRRLAGVWALALTGFYNTMPAYYVNWGRYTQLTGQVIVPALLLAWLALLALPRARRRALLLAALLTAALMLTHYIVTIFAALGVGAYLIMRLVRTRQSTAALRLLGWALGAAALAVLLAAPWLLNTLSGYLVRNTAGFVNGQVAAERIASEANLPPLVPLFLKGPLLVLALLGLCLAARRRRWRLSGLAIWALLLLLTVVPHVVGLPGSGVINWLTAYIALYLPVIPLAAYAISEAHLLLRRRAGRAQALASVALIVLSVWGVRWQQQIIDPQFQLFTRADAQAMEWIRANTPPDALFHVNMFPAYGGTLFAGSDGGWWIPLLTGRASTLPPLTYGSERGETPDYYRQVNNFGYALREHRLPSAEAIRLLRERGVDYIYLGAHRGQDDPIDAAALRAHPAFEVVYERDGVVIVRLRGQ